MSDRVLVCEPGERGRGNPNQSRAKGTAQRDQVMWGENIHFRCSRDRIIHRRATVSCSQVPCVVKLERF